MRAQLQRLVEHRRQLREDHLQASQELRDAIRRAQSEGMTMVEIARVAGVSRQGLYKLMRGEE